MTVRRTAEEKLAESAAAADGERGLHGAVDEIVESVLDAADEEILTTLAEERGLWAPGPELLREMMLDVLARYEARRRRTLVTLSAGAGS